MPGLLGYLNTSYVKVQYFRIFFYSYIQVYLNTSYVKVQFITFPSTSEENHYLNTSYVKVQYEMQNRVFKNN